MIVIKRGDDMEYVEIDGHKLRLCPVPELYPLFMISRSYMKNWSAISGSL